MLYDTGPLGRCSGEPANQSISASTATQSLRHKLIVVEEPSEEFEKAVLFNY